MKALLALGLLLSCWSVEAAPALPSPDDPQALSMWFQELGIRREGSSAEAQVFEALHAWFDAEVSVDQAGFEAMEGEHSFSSRLWFRVAGKAPGDLLVVAPTDGGNHRGLAWAVAWAHGALKRGTPVSLIFVFTGAERGPGAAAGLGSRAFLQDYYPTTPAAVVYLDTPERSGHGVELTTESGLFPSPLWMVRGFTESLQHHGLESVFTGSAPSLFRLDLPERRNALGPWFDRSIPGLLVAQGPATPEMVQSLEEFTASLSSGVPDHWDRHYLTFDFGAWKSFWSQGTYLTILLAVAALLLAGYALAGRDRRGSLKILGTGFWQIPVLFSFLFLTLYAGTVLASLLQEARGLPEFWRVRPLLVWVFKAMTAVTLYLFLFLPFRRSPLSRDPDFYGQAALLWLGTMVLVSAAMELSFSFYFLWALIWCAVLVVAPWRPLRLLALAAGPLWLVKAAWDVLGPTPDLALSQWALGSPLAGNLALALLFFPFLLQINAWHHSGRSHQNRDEGLRAAAQLALFGLATLFLGLAVLRAPLEASEAPEPPTQVLTLMKQPRPELWSTKLTRSGFLDRTVWTLEFSGLVAPDQVQMTLSSEGSLTVFDSSFPVTLDAEGSQARIVIGRQPSLPLTLRLTLPQQTRARLDVVVELPGRPRRELQDSVELAP